MTPVRRGGPPPQDHTARQREDPTRVLKFQRNKLLVSEKSLLETGEEGSGSSNSVGSQEHGRDPPRNTACCGLSSLAIDACTHEPHVSVCNTCACVSVSVRYMRVHTCVCVDVVHSYKRMHLCLLGTCVCTCTHMYQAHTRICLHIYMFAHVCWVHVFVHTCMCTYLCMCVLGTCMCVNVCARVCVCVPIHTAHTRLPPVAIGPDGF